MSEPSGALFEIDVSSVEGDVQRVFDIVKLSEIVAMEPRLDGALQRIGWRREQTAG